MELQATHLGFQLSREAAGLAMMSSDSVAHKEAYTWLSWYIRMVGDKVPNRKNQIHLEYRTKYEIWEEYRDQSKYILCSEPISYSEFVGLWERSFSHVKIRKYKAVEGKCSTCAVLTQLRSKAKTEAERAEITKLHYWHR
jgi:hypothetical protein